MSTGQTNTEWLQAQVCPAGVSREQKIKINVHVYSHVTDGNKHHMDDKRFFADDYVIKILV